jgi:hypothetical protein
LRSSLRNRASAEPLIGIQQRHLKQRALDEFAMRRARSDLLEPDAAIRQPKEKQHELHRRRAPVLELG